MICVFDGEKYRLSLPQKQSKVASVSPEWLNASLQGKAYATKKSHFVRTQSDENNRYYSITNVVMENGASWTSSFLSWSGAAGMSSFQFSPAFTGPLVRMTFAELAVICGNAERSNVIGHSFAALLTATTTIFPDSRFHAASVDGDEAIIRSPGRMYRVNCPNA